MTQRILPDHKEAVEYILLIGAGAGQALDQLLALDPISITLVEPNYENLASLRITTAGNERINIIDAAVSANQTGGKFLHFNFSDLNALCLPTGIHTLFPGLKLFENAVNLLIIEAPGVGISILAAFEDAGMLSLFCTTRVQAGHIPLYENEAPISVILEWLIPCR